MTEHEALAEFAGFSTRYIEYEDRDDHPNKILLQEAESMRENLTFIGEKEYAEATAGTAQSGKIILTATQATAVRHHKNRRCVPEVIMQRKSDVYLFERVLSHFVMKNWRKYTDACCKIPKS